MDENDFQNISEIILQKFDLQELKGETIKDKSYFLRKPVFSFKSFSFDELLNRFIGNSALVAQSLGEVAFPLNINDLLATEFSFNDFHFARMMPIKTIDFNARDKYLLKQKLNFLLEFHLQVMFDDEGYKNLKFSNMIDEQTEWLDCNPLNYLNQLNQALATIEIDEYCEYLRNLYYQDLYSLEYIHLKIKGRDTLSLNQNSKEELQIIYETLETAIQSKCFHKIFKSILHTNQISNSTLNDEICLFTTNWTYSKAILKSLRDEIRAFIKRNIPTSTSSSRLANENLASKKQLLTNLTELNDNFLLFSDLDDGNAKINRENKKALLNKQQNTLSNLHASNKPNDQKQPNFLVNKFMKNETIFEYYLNELNFLSIDLARDLLLHLANNIQEEVKSNLDLDQDSDLLNEDQQSTNRKSTSFTINEMPPVFQLLMHDNRKKSLDASKFTINLHIDHANPGNAKFINQIKTKLQSFINQLYHRKLLKKNLLNLSNEPDVEMYLNTIWTSIISIIRSLNNIDQSYLAEIFLANKRHLQSSSSFISRKYLYYIIRSLFETLYLVCSTIYDKFPVRLTTSELEKNKTRLDNLIDQAFLIHLKNEMLIMLADADPSIQIERPNLTKFIYQKITRQNITELLSQLISLIRLKHLQCSYYSSPLYAEFVKINEKFKNADDFFEKQMNVNFFKMLNLDRKSGVIKDPAKVITDIIENEILMRYLNLTPKLECLEQVAEIGAQIVLELGMKKNLYRE